MIYKEVKMDFYERVMILNVVYDSKGWLLNKQERNKIKVFEMICLRNISDIRKGDRVINSLIRQS